MGDCARVVFHSPSQFMVSPIVYLHSHGGLAVCMIEVSLPRLRTGDATYSCARFIGEVHMGIPGNTSLGVFNVPSGESAVGRDRDAYRRQMKYLREVDWEERGMFLVDVDRWRVTHAGSCTNAYGDAGDGFGMQEQTDLESLNGVVQLPLDRAGS